MRMEGEITREEFVGNLHTLNAQLTHLEGFLQKLGSEMDLEARQNRLHEDQVKEAGHLANDLARRPVPCLHSSSTGEWLMSGSLLGVGANLTTYAILTEPATPYIYSNLSLSFRLPGQLTITPMGFD